jgi:hypothetical protein
VFESLHGYGVYTARAIQLAKMVIKIKYSNGLSAFVKEYSKRETYIMYSNLEFVTVSIVEEHDCMTLNIFLNEFSRKIVLDYY